ncbi:hypothetical protein EVAR_43071_1 [Eumeta japonica]|uniref:Uncharacterized protein n=1 Tax=Eumeta variegata TaxID=151549 RepID=A0A4C1WYX8_EUMVA|nr:hypothetical protein EVAR_43071_1 [Eumeta japonica]
MHEARTVRVQRVDIGLNGSYQPVQLMVWRLAQKRDYFITNINLSLYANNEPSIGANSLCICVKLHCTAKKVRSRRVSSTLVKIRSALNLHEACRERPRAGERGRSRPPEAAEGTTPAFFRNPSLDDAKRLGISDGGRVPGDSRPARRTTTCTGSTQMSRFDLPGAVCDAPVLIISSPCRTHFAR